MKRDDFDKSDEQLERELAIMTVLHKYPMTSSYLEFRELFAHHLADVYFYSDLQVEWSLVDMDRGGLEFPRKLGFEPPAKQTPPKR